jgi:hypothetical protein
MTADEESYFKEAVADLPRDENLPIKSIISALNNSNFFTSCPSAKEFTKQQIRDKYKSIVRRENRVGLIFLFILAPFATKFNIFGFCLQRFVLRFHE